MARQDEERKSNVLLAAIIGAAGLAIGWAVLELGFGGILNPAKEEPKPPKDPAVILVEEVDNKAKKEMIMKAFPDTRTQSQIEEDEIVEALDEGTLHDINKQRREHSHEHKHKHGHKHKHEHEHELIILS